MSGVSYHGVRAGGVDRVWRLEDDTRYLIRRRQAGVCGYSQHQWGRSVTGAIPLARRLLADLYGEVPYPAWLAPVLARSVLVRIASDEWVMSRAELAQWVSGALLYVQPGDSQAHYSGAKPACVLL